MNPKPRRQYTEEFKAQAVALADTGRSVTEIARELCMSANLLHGWRQAARRAQGGSEGPRAAGEGDAADDLRALRRELARLRQENDILKKAAVILGTSPRPDSAP
ncbi:transposase [Luteolibacter sp. Populi]|uniref:transposase n=1 Tax=Luteolibacter sp. Populi TaxID=3230487 RepID=UPI00346711FD